MDRTLLAVAGMVLIAPCSVLLLVGWFMCVDRLLARHPRSTPRVRPYPYPVLAADQRVPPAGDGFVPVPHERGGVGPMTAPPHRRVPPPAVDSFLEVGLGTTHLAGGSGVPPVAKTKSHATEERPSAKLTITASLGVSPGS
jgi:hypothetical protein